jgi:CheY-like chemotaxis protein
MKHILIVDDDMGVLSLVAKVLGDYNLLVAYSGGEALAAASRVGRFDLLVTDFLMPSMTGDELIGRLREAQPDLKVLVLTAHTDTLSAANLPWWDAERRLAKPFGSTALRNAVTDLIGPP